MAAADLDIVEFASEAAQALSEEFSDDPRGEFFAWLDIAQRREAMVAEAYHPALIAGHLSVLERDAAFAVEEIKKVGVVIGSVWAQEMAHDQYIASIRKILDPPASMMSSIGARLNRLQGSLEGATVGRLASHSWIKRAAGKIALAMGSLVTEVPEFAAAIGKLDFAAFCQFNAALETTAVDGYRRVGDLAPIVAESDPGLRVSTFREDNHRTWLDERYHLAIFAFLADWSGGPPPGPPGTAARTVGGAANTRGSPSTSRKDIENTVVRLKKEIYGELGTTALLPPSYRFRDTPEELLRDPVIRALRRYVGHTSDELVDLTTLKVAGDLMELDEHGQVDEIDREPEIQQLVDEALLSLEKGEQSLDEHLKKLTEDPPKGQTEN